MTGNVTEANSVIGSNSSLAHRTKPIPSNPPLLIEHRTDGDKFKITGSQIEAVKSLIDNGPNAAIAIGIVDHNGTQFIAMAKRLQRTKQP